MIASLELVGFFFQSIFLCAEVMLFLTSISGIYNIVYIFFNTCSTYHVQLCGIVARPLIYYFVCYCFGIYLYNRVDDLVCFVFMKPNGGALAMVLKSGEGVGSEPVEKNVMRHVYQHLETTFSL